MRIAQFTLIVLSTIVMFAGVAFAEDAAAVSGALDLAKLGLGIAVVGGALGQGKIISSALESIARNPGASGQMFLVWILGAAFVESLVIFCWLKA